MTTAAQQLSQWIENTHPDFFNALFSYVAHQRTAAQLQNSRLRGFGDDDFDFDFDSSSINNVISDTAPQAIDFSDSGLMPSDAGGEGNLITSQYTPGEVDIQTLTASDLNPSSMSTSIVPSTDNTLDVATGSSGGFLSDVGSGISSAAGSVANFLTSAQGLGDVAKLATAYFQVQNTKANAAIQTQLLQAQVARAAAGVSPAPVTYALNSAGQLVPIYSAGSYAQLPAALQAAVAAGQSQLITTPNGVTGYTVPSNIVGALGGTTSLSSLLPWVALIVGGLLLVNAMEK